jgi:hypothetical protein
MYLENPVLQFGTEEVVYKLLNTVKGGIAPGSWTSTP